MKTKTKQLTRQLTRKVTIKSVSNVENSEYLDKITFKESGWSCVTQRDTVKVGDVGVYFEIDSLLPIHPAFNFLSKNGVTTLFTGEQGYRLKTMNFRGQISQGLFLAWNYMTKFFKLDKTKDSFDLDLNVIKFERQPSISMYGDIIDFYPGHTPKTYQDRIQNLPELFDDKTLYNVAFEKTIKLEGTSTSFICLNGEISPASHNTVFEKNEKFLPWKYFSDNGFDKACLRLKRNITIQGEFVGPKIQGNIENFKEFHFFIFNIFDIDNSEFLSSEERLDVISQINEFRDNSDGEELKHVPILDKKSFPFFKGQSMDNLIKDADGKSINAKRREGLVYKSIDKINGDFLQFKIISNKYLQRDS